MSKADDALERELTAALAKADDYLNRLADEQKISGVPIGSIRQMLMKGNDDPMVVALHYLKLRREAKQAAA